MEDLLSKWAANQMLIKVSTRKFERSVRLPEDDDDTYQLMPALAYTRMFERMLAQTRIMEFKRLTAQKYSETSVVREYPVSDGDPYYPIHGPENEALCQALCGIGGGRIQCLYCRASCPIPLLQHGLSRGRPPCLAQKTILYRRRLNHGGWVTRGE